MDEYLEICPDSLKGNKEFETISALFKIVGFQLKEHKDTIKTLFKNISDKNDSIDASKVGVILKLIQNLPVYLYIQNDYFKLCYEALWESTLDSDKNDKVYPVFADILLQLEKNEIAFLFLLSKNHRFSVVQTSELDYETKRFSERKSEFNEILTKYKERFESLTEEKLWFYNNHLSSFDLMGCWEVRNQDPLFNPAGTQTGVRIFSEFRLTDYGKIFTENCIPKTLIRLEE